MDQVSYRSSILLCFLFESNAAGYAAVTNMEIVQDLCLSLRAIDMFERNETPSLDQRF